MSVMSGIATDAFHDEFDSELSMLSDDIDASIQASAALQVIRSVGRVPKYMRTVSHGTIIQACFESASLPETIDALESFTGMISEQWKKFRYMLGKWKQEILVSALGATVINAVYKSVKIIKNSEKLMADLYDRVYKSRITDSAKGTIVQTVVVKRNKEFSIMAKQIDVHKLSEIVMHDQDLLRIRIRRALSNANDSAAARSYKLLNGRIQRASRRVIITLLLLMVSIRALGLMTKNTPAALYKVAALPLPTDKEGMTKYIKKVVSEINAGTAFTLFAGGNSYGSSVADMASVLDVIHDATPEKLTAAVKERADIEKRFAKLADVLQAKTDEAARLDNTYSTKAITFTTAVCKAIIDKCMSPNKMTARLAAKLDKFMDNFHEEANAD